MKLLSFAADGKDCFVALRDDGVVTLNDKVAQPSLRAALAAGAINQMRSIAQRAAPIGKGGRHIAAERALEHVAGYTCFVDGSVRDYQKFSVTSGKNFPGTGP